MIDLVRPLPEGASAKAIIATKGMVLWLAELHAIESRNCLSRWISSGKILPAQEGIAIRF
jgi:hypothetical protein